MHTFILKKKKSIHRNEKDPLFHNQVNIIQNLNWVKSALTEQFDRREGAGTFSSTWTSFFFASSFCMLICKASKPSISKGSNTIIQKQSRSRRKIASLADFCRETCDPEGFKVRRWEGKIVFFIPRWRRCRLPRTLSWSLCGLSSLRLLPFSSLFSPSPFRVSSFSFPFSPLLLLLSVAGAEAFVLQTLLTEKCRENRVLLQ